MYKLTENGIQRTSDNAGIPLAEGNRDYQQFIQDVAEQGIGIVEGKDVIAPDYVALRTGVDGYASTGDQLDMQYKGTWEAHIEDVKTRFPKTNTGSTTIADVDDWVQEKADEWTFNKQLREYTAAIARLDNYILADGRAEVTEMQDTLEVIVDDNGMPVLNDDGEPTYVQEEVVVVSAIEPLDATVEVTTQELDEEPVTTTVANPLIVKDDEERAAAQTIIDNTPQEVKDQVPGV
jgi:hypothetical protein